jgi:outer membrane protein assembly factor BamB
MNADGLAAGVELFGKLYQIGRWQKTDRRVNKMRGRSGFILIAVVGTVVMLSGCGTQDSNRPLLSAPPSAAADNDIYMADAAGRIRALQPDGKEQWVLSLPDEIRRMDNSASRDLRINYLDARSGGKLFGLATQESGRNVGKMILFALDGNHLLWQISAPYPEQNSAPVAVGPTAVYVAGDDGILYAFARIDGHQLWKYQVSQGSLGAPTVGVDGIVYVTGPQYNLHSVAPDGSQRWVIETQK